MNLWRRVRSLARSATQRERMERSLDSELDAYAEMLAGEHRAHGLSAVEARRRALVEVGGMEQVKQAVRDQRAGVGLELLGRDVAFGWRQIVRNPGFALTVILTLTLSIGVNTAIFSIVNALMLKSLPYAHPERMATIFRVVHGAQSYDSAHSINGEVWELLRDDVPSLLSAVWSGGAGGINLQAAGHADYVHAGRISQHYLDVLGVRPALGRNFTAEEDRPNGPPAAILSYSLWKSVFAGDRNLVGQSIHLKGEPYTVVGVLPAGVQTPLNADLYTPLQPSRNGEGGGSNYDVIVRLRDGANWQQADSEIDRAWAGWAKDLADEYSPGAQVSFHCVPLQEGETATLRPKALALMLAAALILLIACANLAGLTLVRVARRTSEIATRLALGASHWQIRRQLWIENLLLACLGGVAGIFAGYLALRGLLSLLPIGFLPVAGIHLDGRVLAFTFTLSVLTSVLFGMLPAMSVGKVNLRSSMASRAVAGSEHARLRQVLIAGEVALTVVLLAGAGLLIRTLVHLETLPAGFNPHGLVAAKASLDDVRYHDPARFHTLLDESIAAIKQIPGVENAAVALSVPYERILNDQITLRSGPQAGRQVQTDMDYVTPGYFETLQIPLYAGRTFTASDNATAQPVAIVNRAFAKKFFPGVNPVGHSVDQGMRIVGVVGDTQISSGLNPVAPLETEETMYIPAAQMVQPAMLAVVHTWFQPSWVVRTAAPVQGLPGQMQRALSNVAPGLPFSGFYSMSDLQAETLATERVNVALLGVMAGLALLLSAVGIFALVANMVAQRTREIGIRLALGAGRRNVMVEVGSGGAWASALGLVVGLALCAGVLRVMSSVLYGVSAYDAASLAGVVIVLALVTLFAVMMPTLRIMKTDPATTLREE